MGYYTYHTLKVKNVRPEEEAALIQAMEDLDIAGYALDDSLWRGANDIVSFEGADSVKWYSHEEDMLKLSKKFPHMIFKLHGDGEENGDIWNAYYQNGEVENCYAQVVIPQPKHIPWD